MQLLPHQVQELLKVIDSNQLLLQVQELGPDFLTDYDKQLLKTHGIDYEGLYKPELSSIQTSFHFGMLAEALGQVEASKISYDALKLYVREGKYLPITERHKAVLNSIKMQTFSSLKNLNGNIFTDINNIITDKTTHGQQQFLADELKEGVDKRKTVRQIANQVAEKTGDWGRNFDRIIETASQTAYEWGKAAEIERRNPGGDPLVYKHTTPGACKHCIRVYMTNGMGSEPRKFKLSELRRNGDNIGRSVAEWKPTVSPVHPHCRCPMFEVPEGFLWNEEAQSFSTPDPNYLKQVAKQRELIRVVINGKEFYL
ncbi:MAG: hypothetical protein H7Y42_13975 [Chitinophagaceae bacterium]|nr:hypothetical protein [Chitinophagaceae bacterium]